MKDKTQIEGRIEISVYGADEFEGLSEREQSLLSLNPDRFSIDDIDEDLTGFEEYLLSERPATVQEEFTFNTTTIGLFEYIVDNLDAGQNVDASAEYLGLGDGTTPEDKNNRSLNSEIYRKEVTDHADDGNELICSTFLGSDDAQNQTIREVGLFSAANGGTMFNHSTIPEIVKDRTNTMSIDVVLSFDAA